MAIISSVELVDRLPTVQEFVELLRSVGWPSPSTEQCDQELEGSLAAVCAVDDGVTERHVPAKSAGSEASVASAGPADPSEHPIIATNVSTDIQRIITPPGVELSCIYLP